MNKALTIEDIYNLPEGTRAELIDGSIFYMAPPGRKHQQILSALHAAIYNYIQTSGGDCEVYPAPFAVFLSEDVSSYVEPEKQRIIVYDLQGEDICIFNWQLPSADRGCILYKIPFFHNNRHIGNGKIPYVLKRISVNHQYIRTFPRFNGTRYIIYLKDFCAI